MRLSPCYFYGVHFHLKSIIPTLSEGVSLNLLSGVITESFQAVFRTVPLVWRLVLG
jgi:hypothetical protein